MVPAKLVRDIGHIISELNQPKLLYVAAWLSPLDDFTGRERYVLNVRMEHQVESRFSEHAAIYNVLRARLVAPVLAKISRVAVHNPKDYVPNNYDDVSVFESEDLVEY
jgi:hypothetical protein